MAFYNKIFSKWLDEQERLSEWDNEEKNNIFPKYMKYSLSSENTHQFREKLKILIELRKNNLIDDDSLRELIAYASNVYISEKLEEKISGFFNKSRTFQY